MHYLFFFIFKILFKIEGLNTETQKHRVYEYKKLPKNTYQKKYLLHLPAETKLNTSK